mmetsp:Transcript_15230/g.31964  ORF Transcript_15230/g.31964 Transcript_15230/m.31964 type:complete len:488 (+) Transcript_15230:128-1591(+)
MATEESKPESKPEFKLHEAFTAPGAEEYKKKGNEAFKAQNWDEAIKNYNKAITLDPNQAAFYSNRAACWSSKGKHDSALSDANKCIEKDASFVKGYSRKGKALFDMGRLDEAEAAYQAGLGVDSANPACSSGLADIKAVKQRARQSSSPFGGVAGGMKMLEKLKGMMSGGVGGRMPMYMVLLMGYYLMKNWTGKGAKSDDDKASFTHEAAEDDDVSGPRVGKLRRSFVEAKGAGWLSYMESEGQGATLCLFLHRTSLSAEAEYGSLLSGLVAKAAGSDPLPTGGVRLLAPDRPCHGYSPCSTGKGGDIWLRSLLNGLPKPRRLLLVSSGPEATRQALELASRRQEPTRLLVLAPKSSEVPGRGSAAATTAAEVREWLQQHQAAEVPAQVALDAARWHAAGGAAVEDGVPDAAKAKLPGGSAVTVLYGDGEEEDRNLKEDLEVQGVLVNVRRSREGALSELVLSEAWQMLATAPTSEIGGGAEDGDDI